MQIRRTSLVGPEFARWVERRRERMAAQLGAIEEERFEDLADLLDAEHQDPPPPLRNDPERQEYERMLADSETLAQRLAEIRSRLLAELREIDRERVRGSFPEGRHGLGGSLDGYV